MPKKIIITKCTECPHMAFDPDENSNHWGEYVCKHPSILDSKGGVVLEDINIDMGIPQWCPLEDSNFIDPESAELSKADAIYEELRERKAGK